ncbi:hypothetical protein FPQ18DRAFT_302294 [Pyronema domesticum]|nr:hypothetical protein FPQ18DRAFT_302294 [Pyronema domesticum]
MNPPTMETTRKSCKFSHPATEHDAELSYELQPIPETGPSQSDILKENSPAPTIIVDPPTPIETTKPPKPKIHNNISHAPKCSCIRQPIPLHYVSERSCIYQPIPETDRSESDILQQYSPVPTIVVHPPTTTENMKSFKLKPRNNIRHVPECSCIRKPIPTNNQVSERSSCILQPIPEVPPVQDLWKEIKNPTTPNYELRELQKLMKQCEAMILREMQTLRKSMVMQRLIEVEGLRKVEDSWSNKDDGPWICAESRNLITASAKSTNSTKSTKYTKYTKYTNFTISEHPGVLGRS